MPRVLRNWPPPTPMTKLFARLMPLFAKLSQASIQAPLETTMVQVVPNGVLAVFAKIMPPLARTNCESAVKLVPSTIRLLPPILVRLKPWPSMEHAPAPPLAFTSVPNCISPVLSPMEAFPASRRYLTPTAAQPMSQPIPAVVCPPRAPATKPFPLIETYPAPAICLPARSSDAPLATVPSTEPDGTPNDVLLPSFKMP